MPIQNEETIRNVLANWINGLENFELIIPAEEENELPKPSPALIDSLNKASLALATNDLLIDTKIKLLSNNINCILKIDVTQTEMGDGSVQNNLGSPITHSYCLIKQRLGSFTDAANIKQVENDEELKQYLAPHYANKTFEISSNENSNNNTRFLLVPYYRQGTLMSLCNFERYIEKNEDNEKILEENQFFEYKQNYQAYCMLNLFVDKLPGFGNKLNEKNQLAINDIAQLNKKRLVTNQTYDDALKQLSVLKSAELIDEHKRILIAHIQLYHEAMVRDANQAGLLNFEEGQTIDSVIKSLSENYQIKEDETGRDYYTRIIHTLLEEAAKREEDSLFDPFSDIQILSQDVLNKQQTVVWNMAGQILNLFCLLQKLKKKYYDIKPENFLIDDEGNIVIGDTKTMVAGYLTDSGCYRYKAAHHLTYAPAEYDDLLGEDDWSEGQADGITNYQIGALLYNITIGIAAEDLGESAHERHQRLIREGLTCQLDFNSEHFKTDIGKQLKTIINVLTAPDVDFRSSLTQAKTIYDTFNKSANEPEALKKVGSSSEQASSPEIKPGISEIKNKPHFKQLTQNNNLSVFPDNSINHSASTKTHSYHSLLPTCTLFKSPKIVTGTQASLLLGGNAVLIGLGFFCGPIGLAIVAAFFLTLAGGAGILATRAYTHRA